MQDYKFCSLRSLLILMYISYSVYHMVNAPHCNLLCHTATVKSRSALDSGWFLNTVCQPPTSNKLELLAYDLSLQYHFIVLKITRVSASVCACMCYGNLLNE